MRYNITEKDLRNVIRNCIVEAIGEDRIVKLGGRMYPKYGQAVVVAGGGASGKSFVVNNLIPIQGKHFDVDAFKDIYREMLWNDNSRVSKTDPRKNDPANRGKKPSELYRMSNGKDVEQLHYLTAPWKQKQRDAFFNDTTKNPNQLPNVIFDITGKTWDDIMECVDLCNKLGYTMHLVWVVCNRSRALQQNFSRERKAPQKILHKNHNQIIKNLPEFIEVEAGRHFEDCWLIYTSTDNLGQMPEDEAKNVCVQLPRDGDGFVIDGEVEERLFRVLGEPEKNPEEPETYLDGKEIAPPNQDYKEPVIDPKTGEQKRDKHGEPVFDYKNREVEKYNRSYKGNHTFLRKDEAFQRIVSRALNETMNEFFKPKAKSIIELTATSKKQRYAPVCWEILKNAYAQDGGCKSFNGETEEQQYADFVNNPEYLWRVYLDDKKKPVAIIVYKAKKTFGRKNIAIGTIKGNPQSSQGYTELCRAENNPCNHYYGEVSARAEHSKMKDPKTHWLTPQEADEQLPYKEVQTTQNPELDKHERIPYDPNRHYYRDIGGLGQHRKAMWGHPMPRKPENK